MLDFNRREEDIQNIIKHLKERTYLDEELIDSFVDDTLGGNLEVFDALVTEIVRLTVKDMVLRKNRAFDFFVRREEILPLNDYYVNKGLVVSDEDIDYVDNV